MNPFPSWRLRLGLFAYQALWLLGLPLAWAYIRHRARRDGDYGAHLGERFGRYDASDAGGAVWVHAVSLGEFRSAVPLIRLLLQKGERVLITHFTPAGRRESARVLAPEIAAGQVRIVWVPFEPAFIWARFFRSMHPKLGLVMEIEIWPGMIMAARRAGVSLYLCNAQYPAKSYERDLARTRLRGEVIRGYAGAFVKSDLQRQRFAAVGLENIHVTGELRFDQPIPPAQVAAGQVARGWLAGTRPVVALASVVEGEDGVYLDAIAASISAHRAAGLAPPLFVYVPRAPERFDETAAMISARGLSLARRSAIFDGTLAGQGEAPEVDVLLGDSMGEMYFYLSMADRVIIGGGFVEKGAHNIIEGLALGRPAIVGPHIWTIEYPATEAIAAGVCLNVSTPQALAQALAPDGWRGPGREAISAFLAQHSGAAARTLAALDL